MKTSSFGWGRRGNLPRLCPDVYSFLLSQRSKTRFELLPVILLEDFPRQTHPEVIARYDTPF